MSHKIPMINTKRAATSKAASMPPGHVALALDLPKRPRHPQHARHANTDPKNVQRPQTRTFVVKDIYVPSPISLQEAEAILVRRALAEHEGDHFRAAWQLGLTPQELIEKMKRLGLKTPEDTPS